MVHIFYGRENVDKEKFIYDQIQAASKVRPRRTFVIVPDQYTLEGEKQAFRLLGVRGLMDVEVISMSRLGSRLLAEQGGAEIPSSTSTAGTSCWPRFCATKKKSCKSLPAAGAKIPSSR